tara:strand:- start:1359 stop:1547 length:189 start_codon:yes stop_codon:yes gene_type:complete
MLALWRAARSSGLGIPWLRGVEMDDNEDYELANLMYAIATCILVLFALVGIAGLAGFLWGMT